MKFIWTFSILSILTMAGCNQSKKMNTEQIESERSSVSESDSTETIDVDVVEEVERSDDEIREYGRVISIEDSGYPMHIITLEFAERQMTHDFNFNAESGILDIQELMGLKDEYVTFYYTSELEPNLYDIQYKGVTIMGEDAPESVDGLKEITGMLSGAEKATSSDLPSEISITSDADEVLSFEYFVTDEMVKINQQKVTVYYELRGVDTITGFEVSQ